MTRDSLELETSLWHPLIMQSLFSKRPAVALAAIVLAACNRDMLTERKALNAPAGPSRAVVSLPSAIRPEEQPFADLARLAPSSAGMYLDQAGKLVVVVADSTDDIKALAAVQSLMSQGRLLLHGNPAVKIQRGKYSFAQLARWRDWVSDNAFGAIPGVISVDLDEAHNRVSVGLDVNKGGASIGPATLDALASAGIDPGALQFRVHHMISHTGGSVVTRASRNTTTRGLFQNQNVDGDSWSPLVGGIGIDLQNDANNPNVIVRCSIGFIAQWNGNAGFVTASHCTPTEFVTDFTLAYQNYPTQVAKEASDPLGYACGVGNTCRGSDASFYEFDFVSPAGIGDMGLIARTQGLNSTQIDQSNPRFVIVAAGTVGLLTGITVNKMGHTTGWTSGTLTNTCVDHYNGPDPVGPYKVTRCAMEASYCDIQGDSGGSAFLILGGNQVQLLGDHFGDMGNGCAGVFSNYDRINSDMGNLLSATRPATLTAPSVSASMSGSYPLLSWSSVPGATVYYVFRLLQDSQCRSAGFQYVAPVFSTSFMDTQVTATGVGGGTCPYAQYYVTAGSSTEYSVHSNTVTYSLSGGTIQ